MAASVWRAFLLSSQRFSVEIRVRSTELYLDRAYDTQGKDEQYLIGIMRSEKRQGQGTLFNGSGRNGHGPRPSGIPAASRDQFQAAKERQTQEIAEAERQRAGGKPT